MIHIPSDVFDQSERLKSRVIPGVTSLLEVRENFGLPFINNENPDIEIYRVASGREAVVDFVIWPVWVDTEEVILYAMVAYDDNDIVKAIRWDTYEYVRGDGYSSDFSVRMAVLKFEGFLFAAVKEGWGKQRWGKQRKEILLAPESTSHDAIHQLTPKTNRCTVLLFYPQTDRPRVYYLDDEQIGESPLIRGYLWDENSPVTGVFVKTTVAEGEHEVRVTTLFRPGEFRRKFECQSGDILYAYPQLQLVESEPYGLWRARYIHEGVIRIDRGVLDAYVGEAYIGWRRLLFYKGMWLGDN